MLVNCVAYQRGQKLSDIPVGEVRAHRERPDCFVWVALKDPQPGELITLQENEVTKRLAAYAALSRSQPWWLACTG